MSDRIKIYVAPSCRDWAARIELSSGTRAAAIHETAEHAHGATYEQGARLPRDPWRRPTEEEAAALVMSERPSNMATSVVILKLPDELRDGLRKIRSNSEFEEIQDHLRTICELGRPLHCIGPSKNPANLKTVTFNQDTRQYNGLHVDNWDQLDLRSRHLATNRICVNIGQNDRYFLFLPFSLMDIARALLGEMGDDWEPPERPTVIGRQFMERYPEIPIVRCRLRPGEAYIAPTENLVHDGSSVGQSNIDQQFTIRGHIRPL
jgi:hypothetical protein